MEEVTVLVNLTLIIHYKQTDPPEEPMADPPSPVAAPPPPRPPDRRPRGGVVEVPRPRINQILRRPHDAAPDSGNHIFRLPFLTLTNPFRISNF